jgi:hypothetical protein
LSCFWCRLARQLLARASYALVMPRLKTLPDQMHKLDSLDWRASLTLKSYGVRIGIRSNSHKSLSSIQQHLPNNWTPSASPIVDRLYSIMIHDGRRLSMLYADDARIARSRNPNDIFESFESDLRLFVAELARDRVFVHAGVVGWKQRAIVIPGRSFSGKSTLVAELVKAGATYYSDEYAVLDSRGRVHPFLKPLEMREQGDTRQTKVEVHEFGGESGTRPLPVSLVVVSKFREDAKWRPRTLSPGKGVLELLANTVSARRKPEQAFEMLQQVASRAKVLKGVRGEASEIVRTILERSEEQV